MAVNEVEEQSLRVTEIVLWAAAALFLAAIAVLFGCITLLLIFWDTDRLLAAGLIAGVLAVLALVSGLVARRRLKQRPRLLAATLEELGKDRERMAAPPDA